ncbi:MAG: hypothetical protein ACO1RX_12195 [Candidatus Sericytochromatia bacterium]
MKSLLPQLCGCLELAPAAWDTLWRSGAVEAAGWRARYRFESPLPIDPYAGGSHWRERIELQVLVPRWTLICEHEDVAWVGPLFGLWLGNHPVSESSWPKLVQLCERALADAVSQDLRLGID